MDSAENFTTFGRKAAILPESSASFPLNNFRERTKYCIQGKVLNSLEICPENVLVASTDHEFTICHILEILLDMVYKLSLRIPRWMWWVDYVRNGLMPFGCTLYAMSL